MLNNWQHIYEHFNPVAFSVFGLHVHWYGIMYVLALLVALEIAKYFVKKDKLDISSKMLDNYFFWVEIGIILGARIGYIIIYDPYTAYYLTHPWQIFNPFDVNGDFVGIRGMSYHGALIGFVIATLLFCKKYKQNLWQYSDLVAISIPLGYFFGRIGNFLNQELFGRQTDMPWGIYVNGVLRHPSQIYEGLLEGLGIFAILFIYRKFQKNKGELIALYAILYALSRFLCEFWRKPDPQLGLLLYKFSMGQLLSFLMLILGLSLFFYFKFSKKHNIKAK